MIQYVIQSIMIQSIMNMIWLVVYLPLWKIWVSWDDDIPNIWQNEIHVPNHQSVIFDKVEIWMVGRWLLCRVLDARNSGWHPRCLQCGDLAALKKGRVLRCRFLSKNILSVYPLVMTNSLLLKMVIYSWFTHQKWWFSIAMLVYQRVEHFKSNM